MEDRKDIIGNYLETNSKNQELKDKGFKETGTYCSCCGIKQFEIESIKFEIIFENSSTMSMPSMPGYNVNFFTLHKGKHICENCMETHTYLEALFRDTDIRRGGIQYYANGDNPTRIKRGVRRRLQGSVEEKA